jgi:hypothetical protein
MKQMESYLRWQNVADKLAKKKRGSWRYMAGVSTLLRGPHASFIATSLRIVTETRPVRNILNCKILRRKRTTTCICIATDQTNID